jgi:hypothetical protein
MKRLNTLAATAALVASTYAAAGEAQSDAASVAPAISSTVERYVADDIEVVTLPTGEVVVRLVASRRLTTRHIWTNSTHPQGANVLSQDARRAARNPGDTYSTQKNEGQLPHGNAASNNRPDF